MNRGELALEVIGRLKEEYPRVNCTLCYDDAWKLLVSVRLAAQCTDERVNKITPVLFSQFPTMDALAKADPSVVEKIVRPCGLGRRKALDICACMRMIETEYHGRVPDNIDELLKLPGVGRKSANLIVGDVFGKSAIVADTHCIRLSNRIGLVVNSRDSNREEKDPRRVEIQLREIIPPEEGNDLCHRFVFHGRKICTARTKPHCSLCCLKDICLYNSNLKLS